MPLVKARSVPRTWNPEPGTRNLEPGTWNPIYSASVTRTYVRVILVEAAIIAALVVLGRLFS